MMLSSKDIIKVLIRLHVCAGWSAPLLFTNPEDRFSCIKAQVIVNLTFFVNKVKVHMYI